MTFTANIISGVRKIILVIDDQTEIREILFEILDSEGFSVATASDGEEAISRIKTRIPDLILCDRTMPVMDGFELVSRIRADPATAAIPFIFLTGKGEPEDFRDGMDLGADDYIPKPWTVDSLLSAIRMRLRRQEELGLKHQEQLRRINDEVRRSIPREMLDPLRGIISFADVLSEHCGSLGRDYVTEISGDIRRSSRQLLRVIANFEFLLEMATSPEPLAAKADVMPAAALIKDAALDTAKERQRSGDLTFSFAHRLEEQDALLVPAFETRKLVTELLDNALGFSEPGSRVAVRVIENASDRTVEITISDAGCGIPAGLVAELMSGTGVKGGAGGDPKKGAGLIICRELLRRVGGRWDIHSRMTEGTRVRVWIPASIRVESVLPGLPSQASRLLRV